MPILLLLGVCLLLIAWLTASATAVRSVSRIWLRHWVERRLSGEHSAVDAYLDRPQRLLVAASAGTTGLVALAGAALGARRASDGPLELTAWVLGFALAVLVIGQLLPRAIARRWATRLAPVLLPALRPVASFVSPVLGAAQAVARRVVRSKGARDADRARDEIEDLLREGELEGIGEPDEIEIITGVVQFGEKILRDVMTPRTDLFAVEADTPPRELVRAVAESGYSRVPVFRRSLDEIVGMVHVFDVLKAGPERVPPVRPVAHAPETKACSELLFEMLRGQLHLAVVIDEYGGTAGIVTLEDLLEELVGDIRDEHDEPAVAEQPPVSAARVFDASADVDEVARCFGVELSPMSPGPRSLGGVLLRTVGRIPRVGDRFSLDGLELVVVDAEPARVAKVLVHRPDVSPPVALHLSE